MALEVEDNPAADHLKGKVQLKVISYKVATQKITLPSHPCDQMIGSGNNQIGAYP